MKIATTDFFQAAFSGDIEAVRAAIEGGQPVDAFDPITGLTAFHIAIGRNNLEMAKLLIDRGATCIPDKSGRWPSTIAEMCEVSGEMCDFVVDEETRLDIFAPQP